MGKKLKKSKKILLLLPSGMTIRNFMCSDIVKEVLENTDHTIICCLKNPQKYKDYIRHERIEYIEFLKGNKFSIIGILHSILKQRFFSIKSNITLKILEKGPLFSDWQHKLSALLKYPFPKSRLIFNLLKFFERNLFFPNKKIILQFDEHKPDLIFSTHLVAKDEYEYLRIASRLNIPSIGMVKSFDNLTSKGYLAFETDYVFLWNQVMKGELKELYDYADSKIKITGVPQFDIYKIKPLLTKEEFITKNKLSNNKKIVLYATNHKDISPDDPLNIDFLAKNLPKLNAQLIVRLHQMDNISRYESINYENVVFQVPGIEEGQGTQERVAFKNFTKELRDTLFFSDVTINTCSTMTLDSIAAEKPVINIYFDIEDKPYHQSVKRYYDFLHYEQIISSKSTSLANSQEHLLSLISTNLSQKDIKASERFSLSQIMLAGNKGDSSRKVAQNMIEILEDLE